MRKQAPRIPSKDLRCRYLGLCIHTLGSRQLYLWIWYFSNGKGIEHIKCNKILRSNMNKVGHKSKMPQNMFNNYDIHVSRNSISPVVGYWCVSKWIGVRPQVWAHHLDYKKPLRIQRARIVKSQRQGQYTRHHQTLRMLYLESIDCLYIYISMKNPPSLSLLLGEVSPVHVISPKRLFSNCIHLILGKSSVVQYCNSPRHMMRSPHLSLYLHLHLYLYPICTHI